MKPNKAKPEETPAMSKAVISTPEVATFRSRYDCEELLPRLDQANLHLNPTSALFQFSYDREIVSQDQVRNEGVSIAGRDVYYQRYDRNVATLVLDHSADGVDDGVNYEKKYPANIEAEEVANGIGNRLAGMGYSTLIEKIGGGYRISGRRILEKGGVMTRVQDVNVNLIPETDKVVSAQIHIEKATYYDNSHVEGYGVTKKIGTTPLSEINKVAELVNGAFLLTEHGYKPVEVVSR